MSRRRFMFHLIAVVAVVILNVPRPAEPAEQTAWMEQGQRPLNLSLPRDTVFPDRPVQPSGVDRPRGNWFGEGAQSDSPARQSAGRPYGTGFEARQRSMTGGGRGQRGR